MIRRILVALDNRSFTPVAVRAAAELARRHGASVTGLVCVDEERLRRVGPVPVGGGHYAERLRQHRMRQAWKDTTEAAEALREACAGEGIECALVQGKGSLLDAVAGQARCHDLLLLGHRGLTGRGGCRVAPNVLARVLGCGVRPIIAVSDEYRPVRRALVVYGDSPGSAGALKTFLHLRAWPDARVRVVTGESPAARAQELLDEAADYCRAHGWEPEVACLPGSTGASLLSEAARWGSDVVVAGNGGLVPLLRAVARGRGEPRRPLFLAS